MADETSKDPSTFVKRPVRSEKDIMSAQHTNRKESTPAETGTKTETEDNTFDSSRLPKVADRLTWPIVFVVIVGGAERFAFYAATAPWQNYIQNPPSTHGPKSVPGQLNLGQPTATAFSNAFLIFSSLTPIPMALVSDLWLGRYQTFLISVLFEMCGQFIQFATSLQVSTISNSARIGGLAVAMALIGIGAGGVRATFSPLLGDQYPSDGEERVKMRKNGKAVLLDYGLTLQLMYQLYYWATNVASLSGIPAVFLERYYGFWATYLLGLVGIAFALALLLIASPRMVKTAPHNNILIPASQMMWCAMRNGFKMDNTKSGVQIARRGSPAAWSDNFVDEMKMTLRTCRILLSFVVFYLCVNQMSNNFISQAAAMDLGEPPIPNDFIPSLAGIACVLFAPGVQGIYALLARYRIIPSSILLITLGFLLCGATVAYASGVQHLIYTSGPCYDHPGACELSNGPNDISVWVQTPMYIVAALAEILGFVTVYEYSFKYSPKEAKAVVQALSQLSASLGSALGLAISPLAKDPHLVTYYASLAGVMVISAALFWIIFAKLDKDHVPSNDNNIDESH